MSSLTPVALIAVPCSVTVARSWSCPVLLSSPVYPIRCSCLCLFSPRLPHGPVSSWPLSAASTFWQLVPLPSASRSQANTYIRVSYTHGGPDLGSQLKGNNLSPGLRRVRD